MNTRLFINDREVELDTKVDFTINKAFEDVNDPTTIINDYTKTVNIPFSASNNLLFGSIFSVDRQIVKEKEPEVETYDYLFEALSMDGTTNLEPNIYLFDANNTNWTIFTYAKDHINKYTTGTTTVEGNGTLIQCVVNSSPWIGFRVDSNYAGNRTLGAHVPPRWRFNVSQDQYVNATTGELMTSSIIEDATADKHPICLSRNGNIFKWSADGLNWNTLPINETALNRLANLHCPVTIGFDYKRSGGQITTQKYREFVSDNPVCVAYKLESEYPFYSLYNKYDTSREENPVYSPEDDDAMGIYFDPTKKADFKLFYNQSLLMTGYCKLSTVTINPTGSHYNINLFGQLGNIFHELQQLSFHPDTTTDPTNVKYTIGKKVGETEEGLPIYEQYVDKYITKDVVKTTWTNEPTYLDLDRANWNDIIGFACCNQGYNSDFESDTIQTGADKDETYTDMLQTHYNAEGIYNKVAIDALVGDGLLPRQYGEYRSYYQTPYIFVNKMFQMLQKKCKELTDYDMILNPEWFNPQNPYYSKLVMMLNNFDAAKDVQGAATDYLQAYAGGAAWTNTQIENPSEDDYIYNSIIEQNYPITTGNQSVILYKDPVIGGMTFHLRPDDFQLRFGTMNWYTRAKLNPNNAIKVDLLFVNQTEYSVPLYYITDQDSTLSNDAYTNIKIGEGTITGQYCDIFAELPPLDVKMPSEFLTSLTPENKTFQIQIRWSWENDTERALAFYNDTWSDVFLSTWTNFGTVGATYNFYYDVDLSIDGVRSNTPLTLNQFWDENTSFFDCILNYCKTYGIIFIVDDVHQTVTLMHRSTYFKDFTITDWSDKLDRTKDFVISPVTFDTKYVSFNYDDNDTDYNIAYSKKYNVNYGGLKLKTEYQFNNDNTDLFKGLKTSLVNTATVLSANNIWDYDITYYQTGEVMPYFEDEDKRPTDSFGCFYFYKGLTEFDPELGTVRITDDTTHQTMNQKFMYLKAEVDGDNEVEVTTYPFLDIVYDDNLCLFNVPSATYDIMKDYDSSYSIYRNFWKNWMDEQYNIQNKKITCYLNIRPIDFLNFAHKHFILIHNQLYLVNKIYDYNISDPETTKCELIGIQDTSAYTDIPFENDYLFCSDNLIELQGGESKTIKVYSNNGYTVSNYSTLILGVSPNSSTKEVTDVTITAKVFPTADSYYSLTFNNGGVSESIVIKIKKSVIENGNS